MLYGWGQYYLQCFPEKAAAYLEYLQFLTKYGVIYSVPTLIRLDNRINQYFVQHLELQWDTTCPFVQRVLLDIGIEVQKGILQALPVQVPLVSPQPQRNHQSQQVNHNNNNSSQNHQGSGRSHRRGGSGHHRERSDNQDRRCKNYNFNSCDCGSRCDREHVYYYCGSQGHKGGDCPDHPAGRR